MRALSASLVVLFFVLPSIAHAEPPAPTAPSPAAPTSHAPVAPAPALDPSPAAWERPPLRLADPRDAGGYQPPTVVDYYGGRIPRDSTIEERPRAAFVATGLAMAATAYTGALLYAIGTCGAQMECRHGSAWLYAPLVGPFLTAGQAPTSGGRALAIFDGSLQTIGVALFLAGYLAPKKVVVTYAKAPWRVEPVQMGSGMGLGLTIVNR